MRRYKGTKRQEFRNVLIEVDDPKSFFYGHVTGRIVSGSKALGGCTECTGDSFADTGLDTDPEVEKLKPGRYWCTLELHYEPGHPYGAPEPSDDSAWLQTKGPIVPVRKEKGENVERPATASKSDPTVPVAPSEQLRRR